MGYLLATEITIQKSESQGIPIHLILRILSSDYALIFAKQLREDLLRAFDQRLDIQPFALIDLFLRPEATLPVIV